MRVLTGNLSVASALRYTQVAAGFEPALTALIEGPARAVRGTLGITAARPLVYARHAWGATGSYAVVLRAWNADHPGRSGLPTILVWVVNSRWPM